MQLWLRLTVLGVCAAAGLSLAVAMAIPYSTAAVTDSEASGERESDPEPSAADEASPPEAPPVSMTATEPHEASPALADSATLSGAANPERRGHGERQAPRGELEDRALASGRPELSEDILDAAFQRWSAAHWPPVTRQFEMLDQALKAAQKLEQASQAVERMSVEQLAPPAPTAPPAPERRAGTGESAAMQAPEVEVRPDSDLVSINAIGSDVREVLKALSEAAAINILASPSVTGTVTLSLTDVAVDTALNAILKSSGYNCHRDDGFVFVGTIEELQKMAVANDQVNTRIYRPNYVSATELQKLITSMLTPGVGASSISTAAEVGIASSKDQAGGDAYAGTDVLVVRDFDTILERIDQVYQEVDRMPSQVVIEAMILSVRLDDQDSVGVDFELLRNKEHIRLVSGTPLNSLANLNFDDGLKVGFLDTSLFAFLDALETIGDTNVVATPRVMCLNKQRAEILIGSELGYISTTVTETAATQSVEFLEVGTHLKIRPFISDDGMVRLEVHPELSTGSVRVQEGFTLPDKDVTQVTTNVMCRSGATVVIGGLIREDLVTSSRQIPVFGNLPLVGVLFRHRTEDTERREIIVLLTPRIVDEPGLLADGQKALTQSRDRRNTFFDKMQPINKRRIGERYGRLAVSAWAAGDARSALRYVNLAIHYDPLHQNAIDLRQEILAAYPYLEPTTRDHLREGLPPWEHPLHDDSAAAGWPWRDVGPVPNGQVVPVPDAGTSGPIRTVITDAK
ncbi:MAG: type II secretion system protein GspD [Pirellulaceae bacterium]